MSKITTILDAIVTRCAAITTAQTPVKRQRDFHGESELPGIAIYRGPTELVDHHANGPTEYDLPVTVDYYRAQYGAEDPSERAETMLEEIIAAVESDDWTLCGTLSEPVYTATDDVLLPEDAGGVIRASATFVCRFIRQYGA